MVNIWFLNIKKLNRTQRTLTSENIITLVLSVLSANKIMSLGWLAVSGVLQFVKFLRSLVHPVNWIRKIIISFPGRIWNAQKVLLEPYCHLSYWIEKVIHWTRSLSCKSLRMLLVGSQSAYSEWVIWLSDYFSSARFKQPIVNNTKSCHCVNRWCFFNCIIVNCTFFNAEVRLLN